MNPNKNLKNLRNSSQNLKESTRDLSDQNRFLFKPREVPRETLDNFPKARNPSMTSRKQKEVSDTFYNIDGDVDGQEITSSGT